MCFCINDNRGQATVEAAVLLPLFLILLGAFIQPVVLLYDKCVMNAAAAESCRLAATSSSDQRTVQAFVMHHLKAIPNADPFCSSKSAVKVQATGVGTGKATVSISLPAHTLPLLGITAGLVAKKTTDGSVLLRVTATAACQPQWAIDAGEGAENWIGEWD